MMFNASFGADVDGLYLLQVRDSSDTINTGSEKKEKMTV